MPSCKIQDPTVSAQRKTAQEIVSLCFRENCIHQRHQRRSCIKKIMSPCPGCLWYCIKLSREIVSNRKLYRKWRHSRHTNLRSNLIRLPHGSYQIVSLCFVLYRSKKIVSYHSASEKIVYTNCASHRQPNCITLLQRSARIVSPCQQSIPGLRICPNPKIYTGAESSALKSAKKTALKPALKSALKIVQVITSQKLSPILITLLQSHQKKSA